MSGKSENPIVKKRDEKHKRKASKRLSKLEAAAKDEARDAAMNVAELFATGWKGNNFAVPEIMASSYDVGSDGGSRSSKDVGVGGIDNAIRRGLQKGNSELNERSDSGFLRDDASDFDLTTITEDGITNMSGDVNPHKRKDKRKKEGKQKKKKTLESLSKELSHDAWMCGVCGKAFSSLSAADKHEDNHIQEVVYGLGWGGDYVLNGGATFSAANSVNSSHGAIQPRQSKVTFRGNQSDPVRQMHAAPAGLDPLLNYEEPDESLLLSNNMKQAIVLADEGLVSVCVKAEKYILTETEREAERELELLAKDKAYYDLIAERTLTRQRNPASRFRSEGKTVLSKVQNKFVDAYQLMKEGDPQGMSSDQYNKKRGGQDDSDHVILHGESTLYVNVMVKNSIQVVSHELERLAKKRWEDAQGGEGNRFERFRAIAHGNLGKELYSPMLVLYRFKNISLV